MHSEDTVRDVGSMTVQETGKDVAQMPSGLVDDLAKADTSADGRRAAADGAARRRHVLLRFPHHRSLQVRIDRAARQLVRAVRGAVHVLPGGGELVCPGE